MAQKYFKKKTFNILSHQGNVNQNNPEILPHTSQNGEDQKFMCQKMVARMWRKRNTPPLLVQPLWKSVLGFLRKLDIVLPEDTAIPLLGIYPEDFPTGNKNTCSTIFIAALFVIASRWKEPRCPSTGEWIQKMWYIYTMEYYSAIKKSEYEIPRQMGGPAGHHPE